MTQPRRILVTAALPYANGHIHLGHLVEYIQTDIWVRFQKLRGHDCKYICADDTHGTAIMIRAREEGRREEELIADMREAHIRDFAGFDIFFDNYGSTHSEQNRRLCGEIWKAIREAGLVVERDVEQLYDPVAETFLADRFVRGTCPRCGKPDQPGDNCSACGTHYDPVELIDPVSTISGARPERRTARHLFIQLERLHGFLEEWTQSGDHLQPEVANYLKGHFLNEPLRDWDVSRPGPYFGFEIPDSPGNYWYVWFDAPIGYMASTLEWCQRHGEEFDNWWPRGEDAQQRGAEIRHFIGKDITYFHTLFWPAMLYTARFKLPEKIHIHGFLTVNGEKMSKSRGTFILASTYLRHLDPSYLRYYYASKLGPRLDDIDLNFEEFITKVNSDLVGKVVNLASRTARFLEEQTLADPYPDDGGLFAHAAARAVEIAALYEKCDYNGAMREILALADRANKYIEDQQPWRLKQEGRVDELRQVCSVGLNLFRQIAIFLAPVLPRLAQQARTLLSEELPTDSPYWDKAGQPLVGNRVNRFQHMMKRIESRQVEMMIEDSKPPETEPAPSQPVQQAGASESIDTASEATDFSEDGPEPLEQEPLTIQTCSFDEFTKIDMRVARVIAAEDVADSKKLLKLVLSLGGDVRRTVFAGIKGVYRPEELVGQLVICCANLVPRKMRFGTSEGMVLAAGPGGKDIYLLHPDSGAKPGMRVH